MKNTFPALTLMVPLCAATPQLGDIPSLVVVDNQLATTSGSMAAPVSSIVVGGPTKTESMIAAMQSMVQQEIAEIVSDKDSFDEKMRALDDYIENNQELVDRWLQTAKTKTA